MKKFTKLFAVALLSLGLTVGVTSYAQAALGFKVGAATVGDVTTIACTTAINQSVDSFGNGVDMDQVWALQREVGSPGSGVFETVAGHADIFPAAQGGAAVGGPTQVDRYNSPTKACFRLFMTTDGGGTGEVQVVTNRRAPTTTMTQATHARYYDEMSYGLLPISAVVGDNPSYLVFIGAGNAAVLGVVEGQAEGVVTLSSGDSGTDDTDLSVLSYGLITHGTLVSSGLTVLEVRLHMSQITDGRVNVGLADRINAATEEEPFQANSNVVVEGQVASFSNSAVFLFDTDAADAQWGAASMNANTIGNASDEYSLKAPVATTYQILRLEVDSTGDVFWYIDGVLVGAEPLALATTAVLIPHITAGSADDGTGTVNKVNIDYIDMWVPRPAS